MPFSGPDPYGTAGGTDALSLPQTPPDIRIYAGRSVVLYFQRNGPVQSMTRAEIEDVVRTLGTLGQSLITFRVRDDGTVIDDSVFDFEIFDLNVAHLGSGEVQMNIGNAAITEQKIADGSIITSKIVNGAVTPAKLDRTYREGSRQDFPVLSYEQILYDGNVLTPLSVAAIVYRTPVNAIVLPSNNMKYMVEVSASFVINEFSGGITFSINGGLTLNGVDQSFVPVQYSRGGTNAFVTMKFTQGISNVVGPMNVAGVVLLQNGSAANQLQSAKIRLRAYPQLGGIQWP